MARSIYSSLQKLPIILHIKRFLSFCSWAQIVYTLVVLHVPEFSFVYCSIASPATQGISCLMLQKVLKAWKASTLSLFYFRALWGRGHIQRHSYLLIFFPECSHGDSSCIHWYHPALHRMGCLMCLLELLRPRRYTGLLLHYMRGRT